MAIQNLSNDTTLAYLFRKVESGMQALKELISGKVSKSGDTMTGSLTLSTPLAISSGGTGQSGTSTAITTPSQIATPGASFSITAASYRNWGKLAMINIDLKCTTAVTSTGSTLVCTINSGKRPALILNTTDNTGGVVYMDTYGGCYTFRTMAVNYTFAIRTTYLLP